MISRILSIILVLSVAVYLASCSSREKKVGPAGNYQESSVEDAGGNKEDKAQTEEPAEAGKIKESELPEEYRTDLVPIFKGSVIVEAEEDPDHNMFALACYTNKQYDTIKAYYKECMSKYEIQNEYEDDGIYTVEGFIDDNVYMMINVVDVTKEVVPDMPKDAKTGFSLIYQHAEKD